MLHSYRDVVETEEFRTPLADFVPRLLRHTDLPEVARAIAPRKVVLAGLVNAIGQQAAAAEVARLYDGATHVVTKPRADWSAEAVAGL